MGKVTKIKLLDWTDEQLAKMVSSLDDINVKWVIDYEN